MQVKEADHLVVDKVIGKGGYGTVYKGREAGAGAGAGARARARVYKGREAGAGAGARARARARVAMARCIRVGWLWHGV